MVDIFKEVKEKVMPAWAKFVKDGDTAQGTFVGQIVGQIDGYGNEQIIYQLLQEDGESIINVGFGLNKKFIISDMENVDWGQIVGFKYKGKIKVKDKFGKEVEVKDFGIHQDKKIVNEKWLEENKDNMPEITYVNGSEPSEEDKKWEEVTKEDVPFPNKESKKEGETEEKKTEELTDDDKLAVIEKLAKDKLDTSEIEATKTAVMEKTGIAFVAPNYDEIIEKLKAL